MKHLIICPEYPPAPIPLGGIGTYVTHISKLLAESGETVHVIAQLWKGAEKRIEEKCQGRLIIHRVHLEDGKSFLKRNLNSASKPREEEGLFESSFPPQYFSWQASLFAESLIEQEGIDLIEAQDFEAPLYYLQLRRALGLGPKRRPPCIIHLHSPTEIISRYNDWDSGSPYLATSRRLEDYSIAAADALLCPSYYLARQATAHYGLNEGCIRIIPLPIGDNPMIKRDKETWKQGTICYVGRLERRKGVVEWIDAAVNAAPEYPSARFEFIGANILGTETLSGEEFVRRRIPNNLRSRFIFRGQKDRTSLFRLLAMARIAVVPSRWENFPNTCVEAMCSGLPVISTRQGGQAEMIEDGRTGWLTNIPGSNGLAETLKRALETPSIKIAEMGREASVAIRQMCDNKKIVENHLDFRSQIVRQGPKHSLSLPVNLPWAKKPLSDGSARRTAQNSSQQCLAVVITCFNTGQFLDECLQSLKQQTQKPEIVVVVDDGSTEDQTLKALNQVQREGWQVIYKRNEGIASAKNTGIETVLASGLNPVGFAFLRAEDRLETSFIAVCASALHRCPEVGLVSCWTNNSQNDNKIWIRPCPAFPYQWISNDAVPLSAVRTEALREAGNFHPVLNQGYDDWYLFNAVMVAGWVAVTVPRILGKCRISDDLKSRMANTHAYGRMIRELFKRFPDMIVRDAKDIVLLTESNTVQTLRQMEMVMLSNYRRTVLQVLRKVTKKILRRTPLWLSHFVSRMTR